jgi:hypothetical protein
MPPALPSQAAQLAFLGLPGFLFSSPHARRWLSTILRTLWAEIPFRAATVSAASFSETPERAMRSS